MNITNILKYSRLEKQHEIKFYILSERFPSVFKLCLQPHASLKANDFQCCQVSKASVISHCEFICAGQIIIKSGCLCIEHHQDCRRMCVPPSPPRSTTFPDSVLVTSCFLHSLTTHVYSYR